MKLNKKCVLALFSYTMKGKTSKIHQRSN